MGVLAVIAGEWSPRCGETAERDQADQVVRPLPDEGGECLFDRIQSRAIPDVARR